jgi:phage I-like protein
MEDLGNNRLRPRQLCGVALTNKPNLSGLKPLCNSRTEETNQQKQSPDNPAERQQAMNELKQIAIALGLGENATLEDVLAKLQADREAKLESEAADFVAANKAKIADETVVLNAYKKDPEGTKVLVNAMATPKAEPVRIPPTLVIAPKTPAASAVGFSAPDGKVYANKLAYHRTLRGKAQTEFLNANRVELLALERVETT